MPSFSLFQSFSPSLIAAASLFILFFLKLCFPPQGFFAQGFFAQGFFAQGFFTQGFFTQGFFTQGFFTQGFFAQGFFAQGFFAQGFFAQGFFAQGFFAQGFFAQGFFAHGFFAHGFFAHGFFAHGLRTQGFLFVMASNTPSLLSEARTVLPVAVKISAVNNKLIKFVFIFSPLNSFFVPSKKREPFIKPDAVLQPLGI
ncbi:MAG: hypothetical protein OEV42_05560 [Deltaproteobacteria bacterium]|nr:hypothetical protein [Deltaproteobacteria bacterium]